MSRKRDVRGQAFEPVPELLSLEQIAELAGVTRVSVWRWLQREQFANTVRLGRKIGMTRKAAENLAFRHRRFPAAAS
jgi:predicted DNA-binding transcriptional regulator AlpA